MQVKHWSQKFVPHKFFIARYISMHKVLEHINKNHTNLSRVPFDKFMLVLTNSHKFVTCIKMSLYGMCRQLITSDLDGICRN